jgi:hypothetical protein
MLYSSHELGRPDRRLYRQGIHRRAGRSHRINASCFWRSLPRFPRILLAVSAGQRCCFFHDSLRHSADLDLLGRAEEPPTAADLCASLATGLASAAEALDVGPLRVEASGDHVLVKKRDSSLLFKVDITRIGSVLESEIEEHGVEIDEENVATVKAASRDFLLLQKAECGS